MSSTADNCFIYILTFCGLLERRANQNCHCGSWTAPRAFLWAPWTQDEKRVSKSLCSPTLTKLRLSLISRIKGLYFFSLEPVCNQGWLEVTRADQSDGQLACRESKECHHKISISSCCIQRLPGRKSLGPFFLFLLNILLETDLSNLLPTIESSRTYGNKGYSPQSCFCKKPLY